MLAGGTEAMSHHPVLLNDLMVAWLADWSRARTLAARGWMLTRLSARHLKPVIGLLRGLTDPVVGISMGQTAEELAERFAIDREAMDRYALRSHQRLGKAMEGGSSMRSWFRCTTVTGGSTWPTKACAATPAWKGWPHCARYSIASAARLVRATAPR